MRQAKIQISADVQQLKQSVEQAKKTMQGLGQVKISNQSLETIKKSFGEDLEKRIQGATKHIENLERKIESLSQAGKGAMSKEFSLTIEKVKTLRSELENLKKVKTQLETGEIGVQDAAKRTGGLMRGVAGGVGRVAGMVGLGLGVGALYGTARETAGQRAGLRALTGGSVVEADSSMGFTPEERRQRATDIARSLGRDVSTAELTRLTNFGEKVERGYGVDSGTLAAGVRESRRAGITDSQKLLATSIGLAVSQGLEGSRVGEYLSAMTGYMSELADSITVDTDSVNAISAAFGDIPFFKNDPSRFFNQLRGLDQAFKEGDRFQQAQAARAIQASMGGMGATPAAVELRRGLGLFGGNKGLAERTGVEALGVGGGTILQNMFNEMKTATESMSPEEQLLEIMTRGNLQGQGGIEIAQMVREGKGGQITEKQIQMAQMSPEKQLETKMQERLANTFQNADKSILQLNASIKALQEFLANDLMAVLTRLVSGVEAVANFFGMTPSVENAATAVKAGAAAYGVKKIAETGLGQKATGAIAAGVSKIAPKAAPILSKAAPMLGRVASPLSAVMPENLFETARDIGESPEQIKEFQIRDYVARGGSLSDEEMQREGRMPFGMGVMAPREIEAANMSNTNSASPMAPPSVSFPNFMQTSDPEVNSTLRQILQSLQVKSPPPLQDRRGPSNTMNGEKVGMRGR
jgi:hypothetical protein